MTSSVNFVLVVFGLVAVSLRSAHGTLSDEERTKIHAALIPFVAECSKEYGVSEENIKEAKESGQLGKIDPCLMACVFQKIKLIDEKGLFDSNAAVELVQKYISSEDDQSKLVEIIEKCKSVNDEEVSDGEKGCERARLLFECSIPFKDAFVKSRR
ncbi:jg12575 [Pararge aegeria aegeria]|uniref:Jg12575 protein n=1 Tax=Pararge aegeria aegeria TaxID=348720 RepID=A0A8S4S7M7_9NEOP|nr:jg12575 [Pararge aegeria aegeria]